MQFEERIAMYTSNCAFVKREPMPLLSHQFLYYNSYSSSDFVPFFAIFPGINQVFLLMFGSSVDHGHVFDTAASRG